MNVGGAPIWVDVRLVDSATPDLRELRRRLWEWRWADLTGRPWGWRPVGMARVDVTLDPVCPPLSRVLVDGVPLPVLSVDASADYRDEPTVTLVLSMRDCTIESGR